VNVPKQCTSTERVAKLENQRDFLDYKTGVDDQEKHDICRALRQEDIGMSSRSLSLKGSHTMEIRMNICFMMYLDEDE